MVWNTPTLSLNRFSGVIPARNKPRKRYITIKFIYQLGYNISMSNANTIFIAIVSLIPSSVLIPLGAGGLLLHFYTGSDNNFVPSKWHAICRTQ